MQAARRCRRWSAFALLSAAALLLAGLPLGWCQGDVNSPLFATVIYERLLNVTNIFAVDMSQRFHFCIIDANKEWGEAFNFKSDLTFLSNCAKATKGDVTRRLCTSAEVKFYFDSFSDDSGKKKFLKPNLNCNMTSWLSGCEPGWSCTVSNNSNVELEESKIMPVRNEECAPCCEGFFCPRGLTCMIPCPLGSYCPVATLNNLTRTCDPYSYKLPPGQPNHTCGSADTWSDVLSSSEMFCPLGYYCPSTIQKISCSRGHYCRRGSVVPTSCYQKSSCPPNSSTQDITIFGALLMVALSLLLLFIHNFYDQMLTSRERKQARSREAAARYAKETVQAHEMWKSARDAAKKHAVGFQKQLSRTFSRRKSIKPAEPKALGGQLAASISEDKEGSSDLTQMMHSIEKDPDNHEGFNMEIGDKNLKKNMPKGKDIHSRSQIFKYAYGQIEKEKALEEQNKNMSFSGVISMAADGEEIRLRPSIEVHFKNLTLTLKGSKKKLMRSVNGKLYPGHVAAVMGPSGAGKTTFLSAVAGKATGCSVTGQVLINGKPDPIRSYKRIIGFVPQDDIVHGNLTVEENLWFSAKCRLSADLSKAEKVLVVERVIESLGLQAIRDSLVGTVEKRGISGGQRKRVNVGLEMVMEPSLLILDEPTSGLDSSSSQLLLRALRREAAEGVNICMVLHQPSYTLFRMFDDLILLAKGGLLAYHGPVKKLEEYFSTLGLNVPDRVNPPDFFIDVLEGMTKPESGVSYKELPLRWMLHNGYEVPRDMLQEAGDLDESVKGTPSSTDSAPIVESPASAASKSDPEPRSFVGVIWGNIQDILGRKKDEYEYQYSKNKDLSERKTPGIFEQYRIFLGRVAKQRLREARIQAVDFLILGLAGVCLGTLAKMSDDELGALGYTYTIIAVSLLCKIGALRSFNLEKLQYFRERASGMSSLAYFLARDTLDHFNTVIKPIVYLSMFYFFNNPRSSIMDNYAVLLCLVYCVTGIGYFFAIFFQPGSAQLWSALLPVVMTLVAIQETANTTLADLCYTKWALEAFVIANAERYSGVWLVTRCGSLRENHYNIADWNLCLGVLVVYGIVSRCIAFFCMVAFQKK